MTTLRALLAAWAVGTLGALVLGLALEGEWPFAPRRAPHRAQYKVFWMACRNGVDSQIGIAKAHRPLGTCLPNCAVYRYRDGRRLRRPCGEGS